MECGSKVENSLKFLGDLQHHGVEIKKTGYNSFGNYDYATLDDILIAIQPYLAKHNCVVMWTEVAHKHELKELGSSSDDYLYYMHTDATTECTIVCVDNPDDYVRAESHGYGINKNSDKTCKATTISKRYSLINLLGIKSVNEEDSDSSAFDVRNAQQRTTKSSKAKVEPPALSFRERMKQQSTETKRANSDRIV